MRGEGFHLFTLLGFRVSIDPSWFLLVVLIVWSLAQGYFPAMIEGISTATAFWLAVAGALGLFASIVFHEFAHALVARRFGMPISGITLFLFGGVAQLRDEPPNARAEFWVAIAGPISSYLLALVLYVALLPVAGGGGAINPVAAVIAYLVTINVILATFNLLPAFPLDGGRVLRAAIWGWTGSLRRATRVSALLGRGLGAGLMALGVLNIVTGQFIGGMWLALIGFFVIGAARGSELQIEMKLGLKDLRVIDIMNPESIAVPADITVSELVEDYVYHHYHKAFPVVRGERLVGCVRLQDVGKVPRDAWGETKVADVLTDEGATSVVAPQMPVWDALRQMKDMNVSRVMVVENGRLRGMVTMRDLMRFLAVWRELQADQEAAEDAGGVARPAS